LAGLRHAAAAVAALALAGCSAPAAEPPGPPGRDRARTAAVTAIVDGDTIELAGVGPVRLIGVDTPETHAGPECGGEAASAFTRRALAGGSRVRYRLGREPRDRYGRALAYVWLGNGRMLNMLLLQNGHARPLAIEPNVEFAPTFERAAERAREERLGIWRCPGAGAPARASCAGFASRGEAQRHLDANPGDVDRLDGDRDGRACETLP
jgi:micrococcal nuclease